MKKPFLFCLNSIYNPIDLFEKISTGEQYSFFLDSVEKGKNAAYSLIGFNCDMVVKSKHNKIKIIKNGKIEVETGNPVEYLRKIFYKKVKEFKCNEKIIKGNLPLNVGGAIGYFSYDIRHFFEKLPASAIDDIKLPDMYFAFCRNFIIINQNTNQAKILILADTKTNAISELNRIYKILEKESSCDSKNKKKKIKIKSNLTKKQFENIVKKAKDYIKEGDIFQANLSHRLECVFDGNPLLLYRNLRKVNPSPFSCFLNFPDLKIFGCSPERLLKIENGKVITRPIAGTRPRGLSKLKDEQLKNELLVDAKEKAEHIMLVDLERNDLGRVCEYGSVKVNEMMITESYSHVSHIVSNVCGILKKNKDVFDVIASIFPGGTITGCPKIRCMEIIDELEPTARGPYTGSCGWIGYNGDCDLNIIIRTFILKDKKLYFQVGAGIVADSVPEREYHETLHKAKALIQALKETR
ncbi:MAG: anthranilate synthase component I family protein [Elusimicrobia bacterium]|nr:anthranilate synthase component I family protein [Elusimicrobiota bacterium]